MRITLLLAVAAIFGAVQDFSDRRSLPPGSSSAPRTDVALQARGVETPATEVCLGDLAPDVAYQGINAHWRRLRDLVAERPALLVFGADETTLLGIEREREALMELGVLPVAVVGSRLGVARALASRLGLRFTVVADPRCVIAAQFNAIDAMNGRQLPAWFVVDAQRRVRGLGRKGLPPGGYADLAAEALGLPPRTATLPSAE